MLNLLTSLDERGLRIFDPQGHRIYWHLHLVPQRDYARTGLTGGICTAGDLWDQDATRSPGAHPGRLRRGASSSHLLIGRGRIEGHWIVRPGEPRSWAVEIYCRGEGELNPLIYPHDYPAGTSADEFLNEYLYPWLAMQGWSHDGRIECATHRAEREAIEAALAELRALDVAEGRLTAERVPS